MTDPRPTCPSCGARPPGGAPGGQRRCICGYAWTADEIMIHELQAQVAHESGQAASYRVAYEAALARVGSLQDALDQAIRERDSARERIRELDLAVPMAREAGR